MNDKKMIIPIINGKGTGRTELSAFDAALQDMGVCNYNLIALSSVIPPNVEIKEIEKYETPEVEFGHRLYVVKAEMRSSVRGEAIAAGVGWYQLEDGRGLFVEHEVKGVGLDEVGREVRSLIDTSLEDLCNVRGIAFDIAKVGCSVCSMEVEDLPSCVLTMAIYMADGWK